MGRYKEYWLGIVQSVMPNGYEDEEARTVIVTVHCAEQNRDIEIEMSIAETDELVGRLIVASQGMQRKDLRSWLKTGQFGNG